jgi:hypothetical protein
VQQPIQTLCLFLNVFFSSVQADGEAQAATMLGEAISKNPGYLKLRKLKASREIARTVIFILFLIYLFILFLIFHSAKVCIRR